jgi:uncharacterized protein (TIGR02284 family)
MNETNMLNDLVEINHDRIEGYEKAAEQVDDMDLKNVFNEMISQSRQFVSQLQPLLQLNGETPEQGTTARGKIYRAWMDVKATFSKNDRKTALESCEFGEDAALRAYNSVLNDPELETGVRQLLLQQEATIKQSHDRIKALRDQERHATA